MPNQATETSRIRLDAVDIRILREIVQDQPLSPFPSNISSLRKLARRVGVDKETVRMRIMKLQQKEILQGWHAMVNPSAISLKVSRFWAEFASEDSKQECLGKLALAPDLRVIYDYAGNSASFVTTSESARTGDETVKRFPSIKSVFVATMRFPPAGRSLDASDWRIYRAIRSDPQKSQAIIAKETGLGIRTIKRHMSRMADENLILVAPNSNPSKVDGVPAELLVRYGAPIRRNEQVILDRIGDSVIRIEHFEEPCKVFSVIAESVSEAKELNEKINDLPGIDGSKLYFVHGLIPGRIPVQPPSEAI